MSEAIYYGEVLPQCDVCGELAHYDAKTRAGPWAFLCEEDFQTYGTGLGLGRGQRLKLVGLP